MSEPPGAPAAPHRSKASGLAALAAATLGWGFLPLFWKAVAHLPPLEVLAWRIVWTTALTLGLLLALGRAASLAAAYRDRRQLAATALSSVLINGNGLIFIIGVATDRVTEVSLGYYLTPLFNVVLGVVVLRERLTLGQWAALALAVAAVARLVLAGSGVPTLGLGLMLLFGLYGLVRKMAPVEPLMGLHLEMTLATPVALGLLAWGTPGFHAFVAQGPAQAGLLVLAGVFTALPLYFFAYGAKRLPYALVGVFLYVAPSLQLALAVFHFGEPLTTEKAEAFGLLWVAIALYLFFEARRARRDSEGAHN
ncbi:MAG: EamA family transporter RarD [Myxococcota bacterium]